MCQPNVLCITTIRVVESNHVMRNDLWDSDTYRLWHDRLGHPGRDMMIRILKNSNGHPFFRVKGSKYRQLDVDAATNS